MRNTPKGGVPLYSSLYASSMIAENISHDTYVPEDKVDSYIEQGYKINTVEYDVNGIPNKNYYVLEDPQ